MRSSSVGSGLITLGVLGCVASVIWWFIFYSNVTQSMGGGRGSVSEAFRCLFLSTGPCGFVSGMARAGGYLAYEPLLLWISGAALLVGIFVSAGGSDQATAGSATDAAGFDVSRWKALVEVDPDLSAAAAQVRAVSAAAEAELAQKYLVLNDKQYLATLVSQILPRHQALAAAAADNAQLDAATSHVNYMFTTPFGRLFVLEGGRVLTLRGGVPEVLPSLAFFHKKYPGDGNGWIELTQIEDRRRVMRENLAVIESVKLR